MTLKIRPRAKARPRMSKNGHVYTPKETKDYEKKIAMAWQAQNSSLVINTPMQVIMSFAFKRPKSHFNSKGILKPGAPRFFTNVPDLDNIEKAVLDGLNKVAYVDDKLITGKVSAKCWGAEDSVKVSIFGVV